MRTVISRLRDDDRGSLAMAMMAVLVGAMLGGVILSMVITQNESTRLDVSRVHSLHAAQTGIDVTLARIRSSVTVDGKGVPKDLPCDLKGSANESGSYVAEIEYKVSLASDNIIRCFNGYGTVVTPHYAIITSTGTDEGRKDGSRGRTVKSTYVFDTDDSNVPGGALRLYPAPGSSDTLCMDAGSSVAGTPVGLEKCSPTPPTSQVFAYRVDLSIQLVSSVATDPSGAGLCIDTLTPPIAPYDNADTLLVLQKCGEIKPNPEKCKVTTACSPYNQQWSFNDWGHLEGAKTDLTLSRWCIAAQTGAPSTRLTLQSCSEFPAVTHNPPQTGDHLSAAFDPKQTWMPFPTVGAGMAGPEVNELVNFGRFATCLDVTDEQIDTPYLNLFNCKQSPTRVVPWKQEFRMYPQVADGDDDPMPRQIRVKKGSVERCLARPDPDGPGGDVDVRSTCPAGQLNTASDTTWKVYRGGNAKYELKYTIEDAQGFCLAPRNDSPGTEYRAVVAACNGKADQKWNATPRLTDSPITNTHESPAP